MIAVPPGHGVPGCQHRIGLALRPASHAHPAIEGCQKSAKSLARAGDSSPLQPVLQVRRAVAQGLFRRIVTFPFELRPFGA